MEILKTDWSRGWLTEDSFVDLEMLSVKLRMKRRFGLQLKKWHILVLKLCCLGERTRRCLE